MVAAVLDEYGPIVKKKINDGSKSFVHFNEPKFYYEIHIPIANTYDARISDVTTEVTHADDRIFVNGIFYNIVEMRVYSESPIKPALLILIGYINDRT